MLSIVLRALLVVIEVAIFSYSSRADGLADVQKKAEEAKARANEYWRAARAIDDYSLGTIYNEIDVKEHSCAIIASILKLPESIAPGSTVIDPGIKSKDSEALRTYALSLDNYVVNVERLTNSTDYQRRYEWNLNCVGKYGISHTASLEGVEIEFVTLENDGKVLRILGDIEPGAFEKFEKALSENPGAEYVGLGSAGGSVVDAIKIGEAIRTHGLSTVLWDDCYSACSLVFLGGVKRLVYSPYPTLGFHKVSSAGSALPDSHKVYNLLRAYGDRMFGNGRALILTMQSADPDSMFDFPIADMCEAGVATWVQRVC